MRETIHGVTIEWLDAAGPKLGSLQSGLDLIGDSFGQEVALFAIPVARLEPDFLRLSSGLAGEFIEKLQQYGVRLAIVGDISAPVASSKPLHDFVYETNRRGQHLFVRDADELRARLAAR